MSTELNENNEQQEQQQEEQNELDYKAWYEQHKDTIEKLPGLLKKNDELMTEAKKAKEEKRRAADDLAKQNGEYEKLAKQYEMELEQERRDRRVERINLTAEKLAAELSKGDPDKAELLKVFTEQAVDRVADERGHVDMTMLTGIKKQFETEKRYQPLLGGNGSVGGSAPGNTRSAGDTNTISRSDFEAMNDVQRRNFFSKGGKLKD